MDFSKVFGVKRVSKPSEKLFRNNSTVFQQLLFNSFSPKTSGVIAAVTHAV
jgi:hypothetical protein